MRGHSTRTKEPGSIVEDRRFDAAVPHLPSTAMRVARKHIDVEYGNVVEPTVATCSKWDTHFAAHVPRPDGGFDIAVLSDHTEVRAFYGDVMERVTLDHTHCINEINGRWYQFCDQASSMRDAATGAHLDSHVAALFVCWTDGLVGELMWQLEPGLAALPFPADQQIQLSDLLDAFDESWRSGDIEARLAAMEQCAQGVARIADVADRERRYRHIARTPAELRQGWASPAIGRVLEWERVAHLITRSYVFAAYKTLVGLPDRTVVRETVRILPVSPDLKFVCDLNYSLEVAL